MLSSFIMRYVSKMDLYSKQSYIDSTRVEEFEALSCEQFLNAISWLERALSWCIWQTWCSCGGGIAFSDTTGERGSEILVVNLSLFKNRTLLMTDIWKISIFSLCKEVHLSSVCCLFTPVCHTSQTLFHLLTKILIVCPSSKFTSGSNLSFSPNITGYACTKLLRSAHWPHLLAWLCWELGSAFGSSGFPDFHFFNFSVYMLPIYAPFMSKPACLYGVGRAESFISHCLFRFCRTWILSSDGKCSNGVWGV